MLTFSFGDVFMIANIIFFFIVFERVLRNHRKKQHEEKLRHVFDRIPNNDYDALEKGIYKYGNSR